MSTGSWFDRLTMSGETRADLRLGHTVSDLPLGEDEAGVLGVIAQLPAQVADEGTH